MWFLATTGVRFGEMIALRACDVDLERGRATISRNYIYLTKTPTLGTPKSGKSREISVPKIACEKIAPLVAMRAPDELIWQRPDGSPLPVSKTGGGWLERAIKRAQADGKDIPRVTPHGLRHVAAGLMVSAGANVKVIQRQLGHASAAMTLDIYTTLFDADLDSVAVHVDGLFSEQDQDKTTASDAA
nr:site-specific integrase [Corynebacterium aquilae]